MQTMQFYGEWFIIHELENFVQFILDHPRFAVLLGMCNPR